MEKYGIAGQATDERIIWIMRVACWILKVTNPHLENTKSIAFPLQHWLQEGASMLRYTYIVLYCLRLPLCVCHVFAHGLINGTIF